MFITVSVVGYLMPRLQITLTAADQLGDYHLKVFKGNGNQKLPTKYGLRDLWEQDTAIPEM